MSKQTKRILGDQRIFQSVFNDLDMYHEMVTLPDGTKTYAYVYKGSDPYNFEDSAFPNTVAALSALIDQITGEDDDMQEGEDTNQLIAAENQRRRKRNKLRAEQRQRKQQLMGEKEQ